MFVRPRNKIVAIALGIFVVMFILWNMYLSQRVKVIKTEETEKKHEQEPEKEEPHEETHDTQPSKSKPKREVDHEEVRIEKEKEEERKAKEEREERRLRDIESKLNTLVSMLSEFQKNEQRILSQMEGRLNKTEMEFFKSLQKVELQMKTRILQVLTNSSLGSSVTSESLLTTLFPSTTIPTTPKTESREATSATPKALSPTYQKGPRTATLNPAIEGEKLKGRYWLESEFEKKPAVTKTMQQTMGVVSHILRSKNQHKLNEIFQKCYPDTILRALRWLKDGTAFVVTGDIPHMWLRDCVNQVHHYLPLLKDDLVLQILIEGMVQRMIIFIKYDPYANSFWLTPTNVLSALEKSLRRDGTVATGNYEVDSLCYFFQIAYQFWKTTGLTSLFTDDFRNVSKIILNVLKTEQNHEQLSPYRYPELPRMGLGAASAYTGMTWTGFRPSDDMCVFHYNIPDNMFVVVALNYLEEIATTVYGDEGLAATARNLSREIDDGIHKFGTAEINGIGKVYAYEVNGLGGQLLADDANYPNLLSISYLGYTSRHDPDRVIERNSRKFSLSTHNPWFFEGIYGKGLGSPHTRTGAIWPLGLIMQGLTTENITEVNHIFDVLANTDAGTNMMHESFMKDNPRIFTRDWFGWANSLYCEFVLKNLDVIEAKGPSKPAQRKRHRSHGAEKEAEEAEGESDIEGSNQNEPNM